MSSHLDDRGFGGLALIAGGALRIQNRKELEEFLDQPRARELVRTAPYQDVFMLIKTVGLADSLELLPLTSKDQRRGFIDLDCWRKDSFHVRTFMEWLAAFIQCGPEESVRLARAVDPEVLAYFLKGNIAVHELDPEEPVPDIPITLTPDGRFGIEIIGEGESSTISRLLLDAIFRFDPPLGHDLIDRVYWGNLVALEEEAYQNKRLRLEEIGFVDYYDALDIYGEAPVTPPPNSSNLRPLDENAVPRSKTLPALFVASLTSTNYLREGLQQLSASDEVERITHSLAALANRLLSVHSVTPGDLEKVRPALQELDDMLGLGAEYLSQGNRANTSDVLKRFDLQTIFKIGFKLIADLRSRADQVIAGGGLSLKRSQELLLDSLGTEFISGLRRQCPLFYVGLENPNKSSFRNFRSLADLQRSQLVLEQIESLSRGFWDLFSQPKDDIDLYLHGARRLNLPPNEFRFQNLFNTALLNYVLAGSFVVEPLEPERLLALPELEPDEQVGNISFQKGLLLQAEAYINHRIQSSNHREVIWTFVRRWIDAMLTELPPIQQTVEIDPRFVTAVLLYVEPS